MRSAAARAAIRRGSSTRIVRPCTQGSSASTSGTRVVLPAPGGATRTAASRAANAAVRAGSASSIGSANLNEFINGSLTLIAAIGSATARAWPGACDIYATATCSSENETHVHRNASSKEAQMSPPVTPAPGRIAWVDYAKGFCIIMVVTMHSTLGVEAEAGREGFMHALVAFAKPFRMPDFFLISGLFLALVIGRDWRSYLDRKAVHFVYFYLLWTAIQFAVKAPHFAAQDGWLGVLRLYLESFVEPFGTLWFIYLLPIFFVVTKATRGVPPTVIWLIAAALEIAPIETGWTVIDEFAARFVYFYTGYLFAPRIFALAATVQARPLRGAIALAVWALFEGVAVFAGYSDLPVVSLALGLAGAAAVVSVSVLLAKSDLARPLRYCGRNSIVIYLAFFLPMAASRMVLLKTGWIADIGTISAIVTVVGVVGSLLWFWAVRWTFLRFLFERPERFWITPKPAALQPAE